MVQFTYTLREVKNPVWHSSSLFSRPNVSVLSSDTHLHINLLPFLAHSAMYSQFFDELT